MKLSNLSALSIIKNHQDNNIQRIVEPKVKLPNYIKKIYNAEDSITL